MWPTSPAKPAPHLLDEGARLPSRAGVVPQQRIAHRLAGIVQGYHAVLLTGHGHG